MTSQSNTSNTTPATVAPIQDLESLFKTNFDPRVEMIKRLSVALKSGAVTFGALQRFLAAADTTLLDNITLNEALSYGGKEKGAITRTRLTAEEKKAASEIVEKLNAWAQTQKAPFSKSQAIKAIGAEKTESRVLLRGWAEFIFKAGDKLVKSGDKASATYAVAHKKAEKQ